MLFELIINCFLLYILFSGIMIVISMVQRYAKIFNTRDKKCSVSSRGSVDAERFDLFVEGVEDLEFGVQEVV